MLMGMPSETAPPTGPTYIWRDTFTDADSTALSAHTPNTSPGGIGYTNSSGMSITSNQCVMTGSGSYFGAYGDAGVADCTIEIDGIYGSGASTDWSVIFRVPASSTYWFLRVVYIVGNFAEIQIYSVVGGSQSMVTQDVTFTAHGVGTGHVTITLSGSSISCRATQVSGRDLVCSTTSSTFSTNTKHGWGGNSGSLVWDNYTIQ